MGSPRTEIKTYGAYVILVHVLNMSILLRALLSHALHVCIASDIEDFNIRMSESSFTSEMSEDHPLVAVAERIQRENDTLRAENLLLRQLLAPYREGIDAIVVALQRVADTTGRLPQPIGQPVVAAAVAMAAMPATGYELGPPAMPAAAAAAAGPPPEPVRGRFVEPFPEPAREPDPGSSLADPMPRPEPLLLAGPPPQGFGPLRMCQREGCDRLENRQGLGRGFPGFCCNACMIGPSLEEPFIWHGRWCQRKDEWRNQIY